MVRSGVWWGIFLVSSQKLGLLLFLGQ